jgi:hypothetical protein
VVYRIKHNRIKCIALLLFASVPAVQADHPSVSLGGGMSGPVSGVSAEPLARGAAAVGLLFEHQELDDVSDQTLIAAGEDHQDVHSVDQLWNLSLTAVYGLTDDLSLGASLPYVQRSNIREPEHIHGATDEVVNIGNSEGLGDLRLYGQYRLLGAPDRDSHTALILGLKIPTGEDDEEIKSGRGRRSRPR